MTERKGSFYEGKSTRSQWAATEVSIYFQTRDVLRRAARKAAQREAQDHSFEGRRIFRRKLLKNLESLNKDRLSLIEQDVAQEQVEKLPARKPARAELLYAKVSPKIIEIEAQREKASELGKFKRSKILIRAISHVRRMPSEQREELLEVVGFTKEEAKKAGKKIGISTLWGTVTGTAAFLGVNFLAGLQKFHPFIQNITDWKMAASYAAFYGSTALAAITNKKMLDEPNLGYSFNGFPTTAYYILPKFFSKEKKKTSERWGVGAGTFLPNLTGEVMTWGILGSYAGLQGVMGRNIGSTIAELATVAGNLGWLHYKRRKGNQSTVEK